MKVKIKPVFDLMSIVKKYNVTLQKNEFGNYRCLLYLRSDKKPGFDDLAAVVDDNNIMEAIQNAFKNAESIA